MAVVIREGRMRMSLELNTIFSACPAEFLYLTEPLLNITCKNHYISPIPLHYKTQDRNMNGVTSRYNGTG